MHFDVTYEKVSYSKEIRRYAEEKIGRIFKSKFCEPIWVDLCFSALKGHKFVRCHVFTGDGQSYFGKHVGKNFYECIDAVENSILAQMEKVSPVRVITWSKCFAGPADRFVPLYSDTGPAEESDGNLKANKTLNSDKLVYQRSVIDSWSEYYAW